MYVIHDAQSKSFNIDSSVLMAMVEQHILSKQQHAKLLSRQNEVTSLQAAFTSLSVEEARLEYDLDNPFVRDDDLRGSQPGKK